MSPASKTDLELDALIKEYENCKNISEPERNRKLVILRSTKEALTDPEALSEAFAAMVMCFMESGTQSRPSNSFSFSWKEGGFRAVGPLGLFAASMILLAGMFVYSHTLNQSKMSDMSEQIDRIEKMVK